MKHITRWTPDTHDCVIEYEWDDAEPEATRTHTVKNIIRADPDHAAKSVEQQYADILDEHTRRNRVIGWILENVPSAGEDFIDEDGNTIRRLKRGYRVDHVYNKATRCLELTVTPALGTVAKNALQTLVDNRLGAGKVKFL